jgi:Ca2+-binding EF-hand superfamily protein
MEDVANGSSSDAAHRVEQPTISGKVDLGSEMGEALSPDKSGDETSSIDAEIRAALEWTFNLLDTDASGFIEKAEGLMIGKYMGARDLAAFWENMNADMDVDDDGRVSMREYVSWVSLEPEARHNLECMDSLACA